MATPKTRQDGKARSETTMRLFLLAMAEMGVGTPYALLAKAGLSVGATHRVLQGLAADGLLSAQPHSARNRRVFSITEKGRKAQKGLWRSLCERPATSLESALRNIFLIWFWDAEAVSSYAAAVSRRLRNTEENHRSLAADLLQSLRQQETAPAAAATFNLNVYRWIKALGDASLLAAQVHVVSEVAAELMQFRPNPLGSASRHIREGLSYG